MEIKRKPTRHDFLNIITELQSLVGRASMQHGNDRDPHGFQNGQKTLKEALDLCIQARSFDPPTDG